MLAGDDDDDDDDDDDGRSVIADDPEATPPVALEDAEGLVVERVAASRS